MKPGVRAAGMVLVLAVMATLLTPLITKAHCDTMDGPVVADARKALADRDVTPVLKWIAKERESEIRGTFDQVLAVRQLSPQAQQLADQMFFETLVRIHRAGEGVGFTGLKPSGTPIEPVIGKGDQALESGNVEELAREVSEKVAVAIRERFEAARLAKTRAGESVEAGREYVEAYVQFLHFVERLDADAGASTGNHGTEHGEEGE